MRSCSRLALVAILAALLGACAPFQEYRTATVDDKGALIICDVPDSGDYKVGCKGKNAIERRTYTDADGRPGTYYLAFVEFDDQGWFWDRRQMEALLRLLHGGAKDGEDEQFLIFAHAHGWQHNADPCDNNVVCFSRLLERFDLLEQETKKDAREKAGDDAKRLAEIGKPRTVVGVYIGWRGRSLTTSGLDNVSFWERKNTAARVGTGGVFELLTRLNDFRRYKNKDRTGNRTQLMISGHSFGGQVIYTALSHALMERAAYMEHVGNKGRIGHVTANSFGDLVVLVNPAFEGSMYEPLYHIATNRCYPDEQRPVMLIVTSDADLATGIAFPIGRAFNTVFERTQSDRYNGEQNEAVLNTVGHLGRYRTHRLALRSGIDSKLKNATETPCGCPYLGPIKTFRVSDELRELSPNETYVLKAIEQDKKAKTDAGKRVDKDGNDQKFYIIDDFAKDRITYGTRVELNKDRISTKYAPNFPYLVVSTDGTIIPDHNNFYGEDLTDFLRRFYIRHVNGRLNFPRQCFHEQENGQRPVTQCTPSDITPCVESCQRADGSSCTGRVDDTPG